MFKQVNERTIHKRDSPSLPFLYFFRKFVDHQIVAQPFVLDVL